MMVILSSEAVRPFFPRDSFDIQNPSVYEALAQASSGLTLCMITRI